MKYLMGRIRRIDALKKGDDDEKHDKRNIPRTQHGVKRKNT